MRRMSYGIFIFLCSNDNFYARFQRNIENSICADSNLSRQPNSPIDWPGFNPAIVCSAVALIHILLPFLCISKRGVPSLRKLFVTTCSTSKAKTKAKSSWRHHLRNRRIRRLVVRLLQQATTQD